ncbi:EGF-containing fibulin-like extracellular matrix protein 2 isoform X2 [Lampris incognitus]|uniref:EGF-containing fibulin-like extracellular matrix protein 2 isoform X2 n=1 Tax=Lampris incognitus TaxID=2546036 RepID=UPI0024B4D699|nr:EGF-containing fibulin-like extracellular matrix protein 2 isoform X2 [Lampris incognitus]
MPRHGRHGGESKVYVGNLGTGAGKGELERAFGYYGPLRTVWIARNPAGFAFVEFEDPRDAEDAVRGLDGKSRSRSHSRSRGRRYSRSRSCSRSRGRRSRSFSPRRSRSTSPRRSRSDTPKRSRSRSHSRSRSRTRSHSRLRNRSNSGSSARRAVMILQGLLCLNLLVHVALPQQGGEPVSYSCTDGYEYSMEQQECKDINECLTVRDACKGGMRCINHFGGYFCLPQNAQIIVNNGEAEPAATPVGEETPPAPPPGLPASLPDRSTGLLPVRCAAGFVADELNYCRDVNECESSNPCQQHCYNVMGSFICQCDAGYQLASDQLSCQDINECSFPSYMCQWQCVNQLGGYTCVCPEGYQLQGTRMCKDINECETGHNCREDEVCWNYFGGFRCYPRNPCHEPYIQSGEGRCSCQAVSACRGLPPSIVYKYMSITSERSVPADIFQIQATSIYPTMHNTFRIKAGNEGGQFFLRRSSNVSAMLVMTRALSGPREHVVDLEMVTQNQALSYRSSALLRLTIIVGPYAF